MTKFRPIALLLALLLLLAPAAGCRKQENNDLRITVLDVGQSECVLLSLGERHMLIDTGSAVAQDALVGELAARGVDHLELLLVTHPHEDHYGNLRLLLETHTVGTLILPKGESKELGYQIACDTAQRLCVPTKKLTDGDVFAWDELRFEVLCGVPEDVEGNNASSVLRVQFGACVLLFMGDAEAKAESALLARGISLKCDFLKVGHHGSNTASSQAFLAACAPSVAAISCGRDNDYGFPHREVLEGLAAIGAEVWRTDTMGSLDFVCDGTRVTFME